MHEEQAGRQEDRLESPPVESGASEAERVPFPGPGIEVVIFDLDGVVTETAHVHQGAWKSVFDEYLSTSAESAGTPFREFTDEEYARYVDGKPRYEGAESFLRSRDAQLPVGDPFDPPGDSSMAALANRKNERFLQLLAENGVEPYPESVRVVEELRISGIRVALITSSRNGRAVLTAAGLTHYFNAIIDGVDAAEAGLSGKPDPDIFLAATLLLGSTPARAAIVEDSQAGVRAGRRAGFGFVLGVDRLGMPEQLLQAGAHAVVSDLAEVEVTREVPKRRRKGLAPLVPGTMLSEVPSALDARREIARSLERGRPAVFLDYDGTLSPIVDDPDQASMPGAVADAVRRLAQAVPLAIVSGRSLADVRVLAGIEGVFYAGSHGFELAGPGGEPVETGRTSEFERFKPALAQAEAYLREALEGLDGTFLERKPFAVTVHFRKTDPRAVPAIEHAVLQVRDAVNGLRVTGGKKIFELRPNVDWDKGKALEVLLGIPELGGGSAVPVYVGDDLTDEDALRVVAEKDGIGIVVRGEEDRPTIARYSLDDVDAVGELLGYLAASFQRVREDRGR